MSDEAPICGATKDLDGLLIFCGKPPHTESEIHNAIIDGDKGTGSTSYGWWT